MLQVALVGWSLDGVPFFYRNFYSAVFSEPNYTSLNQLNYEIPVSDTVYFAVRKRQSYNSGLFVVPMDCSSLECNAFGLINDETFSYQVYSTSTFSNPLIITTDNFDVCYIAVNINSNSNNISININDTSDGSFIHFTVSFINYNVGNISALTVYNDDFDNRPSQSVTSNSFIIPLSQSGSYTILSCLGDFYENKTNFQFSYPDNSVFYNLSSLPGKNLQSFCLAENFNNSIISQFIHIFPTNISGVFVLNIDGYAYTSAPFINGPIVFDINFYNSAFSTELIASSAIYLQKSVVMPYLEPVV